MTNSTPYIFPSAGGRWNGFHYERGNTDLSVCLVAVDVDGLCYTLMFCFDVFPLSSIY